MMSGSRIIGALAVQVCGDLAWELKDMKRAARFYEQVIWQNERILSKFSTQPAQPVMETVTILNMAICQFHASYPDAIVL